MNEGWRKYYRDYRRAVRNGIHVPKPRPKPPVGGRYDVRPAPASSWDVSAPEPRPVKKLAPKYESRRRIGEPIGAFNEEPRVPDVGAVWDFTDQNLRVR